AGEVHHCCGVAQVCFVGPGPVALTPPPCPARISGHRAPGLLAALWQPVCSASTREPPEAAEPLYPRGGRDERHPVSEEAARRGQGGLSEDRAGQREAAGSALEAPAPGAEVP